MPRVTPGNVNEVFKYHAPTELQVERYRQINDAAKDFAKTILRNCPESREASLALTNIQEARMWANASIALEGLED